MLILLVIVVYDIAHVVLRISGVIQRAVSSSSTINKKCHRQKHIVANLGSNDDNNGCVGSSSSVRVGVGNNFGRGGAAAAATAAAAAVEQEIARVWNEEGGGRGRGCLQAAPKKWDKKNNTCKHIKRSMVTLVVEETR